jgi:hypothetical protein
LQNNVPLPKAGSSSPNDDLDDAIRGDDLDDAIRDPGFTAADIRPMASHDPTVPGAATRAWQGAVAPITEGFRLANTLGKQGAEKIRQRGLSAIPEAISDIVKGSTTALMQRPVEQIERGVAQGEPGTALTGAVDAFFPLSDVTQRVRSGDYAGAAGAAATGLAMLAGPHLARGRLRLVRPRGEVTDAVPEQSAAAVDVHEPPADGAAVGQGDALDQAITGAQGETPAPAQTQEPINGRTRPPVSTQPQAARSAAEPDTVPAEPVPAEPEQGEPRPVAATEAEAGVDPAAATLTKPVGRASDLSPEELREMRRIVHELDAMPFTPRLLQPERYGGGLEHVEGTGGAGAAVYDDIGQAPSASGRQPTRGTVQKQLEAFLGGTGKPTTSVQAAVEIARLRALGGPRRIPGDGPLSTPELSPNAGELPTRLEPKAEPAATVDEPPSSTLDQDIAGIDELGDWFKDQAAGEMTVGDFADALAKEGETPLVEAPFSLTPPENTASDAAQIKLYSTLIPGLQEFVERDIAPVAAGAGQIGREAQAAIAPTTMSRPALRAADILRQANATVQNYAATLASKSRDLSKFFEGKSDDANIDNISRYEDTGQFADAPPGYSEQYNADMLQARDTLKRAYGDVGLVEHYVRRPFQFRSAAQEAQATGILQNVQRSLSGNRSPTRGRVLGDLNLADALDNMRNRGIDVQMRTTNPEQLRQWSMTNAVRALEYQKAWAQLQQDGLISFVKQGARVPEGFAPLEDRVAKVMRPTEQGLVQQGQYYAPPDVARILNNAISTGILENSTLARGARETSNLLNRMQLASAFHGTGTAIRAAASDAALGVRQVVRGLKDGDLGTTTQGATRLAVSPVAAVRQAWISQKLLTDLRSENPSPGAMDFLDKLNQAGGRLGLDERYQTQWWNKLKTEVANQNYPGAAARLMPAVIEKLSAPLMEWGIPRVKLGLFRELAADIDARMGDAPAAAKQRAYAKAWDSVDNRLGQVVYDNLFWSKTLRDAAFLTQRAPGWNLGTMREFGGAALDLKDLARGEVSDRLIYVPVYTAYAMMLGALTMRTMSGQLPQTWKDYFYPRTGERDDQTGREKRVSLPIDLKDVYSYVTDPVGTMGKKESPLLTALNELRTNEEFGGVMVYNPTDPWQVQAKQYMNWLVKQPMPFWLSGKGQSRTDLERGFFGLTRAGASKERSPAETLMREYAGPLAPRTPEQAEHAGLARDLETALRGKDPATAQAILSSGQFGASAVRHAAQRAVWTPTQNQFRRLPLEQQVEVYAVASPQEQAAFKPLFGNLDARLANLPPDDLPNVIARMRELGILKKPLRLAAPPVAMTAPSANVAPQ